MCVGDEEGGRRRGSPRILATAAARFSLTRTPLFHGLSMSSARPWRWRSGLTRFLPPMVVGGRACVWGGRAEKRQVQVNATLLPSFFVVPQLSTAPRPRHQPAQALRTHARTSKHAPKTMATHASFTTIDEAITHNLTLALLGLEYVKSRTLQNVNPRYIGLREVPGAQPPTLCWACVPAATARTGPPPPAGLGRASVGVLHGVQCTGLFLLRCHIQDAPRRWRGQGRINARRVGMPRGVPWSSAPPVRPLATLHAPFTASLMMWRPL